MLNKGDIDEELNELFLDGVDDWVLCLDFEIIENIVVEKFYMEEIKFIKLEVVIEIFSEFCRKEICEFYIVKGEVELKIFVIGDLSV